STRRFSPSSASPSGICMSLKDSGQSALNLRSNLCLRRADPGADRRTQPLFDDAEREVDCRGPASATSAESGDRPMARVLLIIPREQRAEYESVATSFAGVPDCEVIVDRRFGERR